MTISVPACPPSTPPQAVLDQLPEGLVVEICKNILHVCKQMWPELSVRFNSVAGAGGCPASASATVPC